MPQPSCTRQGLSSGTSAEADDRLDLPAALRRRIELLTFRDNSYHNEELFAQSIRDGFAGWYDEDAVKRQVDLILSESELAPSSKILDVACGHGRHAEMFRDRGHRVSATVLPRLRHALKPHAVL